MKKEHDIGVVIGRFQVAELTEAHKDVIREVSDTNKQLLIIIGSSSTMGTNSNPLSYRAREKMLLAEFPNATVTYLFDDQSDKVWCKRLDQTVRELFPFGTVCLYGGRDSFIKCYSGKFDIMELPLIVNESGTEARRQIGLEVVNSVDFRKGIIYSSQNKYPTVFPTVDVAVIKGNDVFMGKRGGCSGYRFIGGFVDVSDDSLEMAARRELYEETCLQVHHNLEFVSSRIINDWRYNTKHEKIMTTFFLANYMSGGVMIGEDEEFESFKWISIGDIDQVEEAHKGLFADLTKHMEEKDG